MSSYGIVSVAIKDSVELVTFVVFESKALCIHCSQAALDTLALLLNLHESVYLNVKFAVFHFELVVLLC